MPKYAIIIARTEEDTPVLVDGPSSDIAAVKQTFDDMLAAAAGNPDAVPADVLTDRHRIKRGRIVLGGPKPVLGKKKG